MTEKAGVGLPGLLGLLFIGLKLGGAIDWSWWWVLAPFWGPFAPVVVLLGSLVFDFYRKGRLRP